MAAKPTPKGDNKGAKASAAPSKKVVGSRRASRSGALLTDEDIRRECLTRFEQRFGEPWVDAFAQHFAGVERGCRENADAEREADAALADLRKARNRMRRVREKFALSDSHIAGGLKAHAIHVHVLHAVEEVFRLFIDPSIPIRERYRFARLGDARDWAPWIRAVTQVFGKGGVVSPVDLAIVALLTGRSVPTKAELGGEIGAIVARVAKTIGKVRDTIAKAELRPTSPPA